MNQSPMLGAGFVSPLPYLNYDWLMMDEVASLPTLNQLRDYVHRELCKQDALEPSQTPLQQWLIMRSSRPCGLFFQISGPRQMRAYAVWAGEENRILFYDSNSLRYAEVKLSEAPDPASLADLISPTNKAS